MKALIIGKNSYIGNHIDEWISAKGWDVEQLDVLTPEWMTFDYSPYDTIIHVAGIVHRPDCKDWNLYKSVNTDMPVAIAQNYKSSRNSKGLKGQYVYFSTMGVYNAGKKLTSSVVDENTPILVEGNSLYGKSKAMAEQELSKLQDGKFDIAFVRPPSVYGKGCKGGYITGFKKIASLLPIIPRAYENACQSFIYIDNLSECVRLIAENHLSGAFCPQDDETPNANRLLEVICMGIGKKYHCSRLLGLCLQLISFVPLVKKAYGGIEYSRKLSDIPGQNYVVVPFEEGMKKSVM